MADESRWDTEASETAAESVYHFPVEVEVVGELGEDQLRQVAKYVFDQLHTTLRSRG
ncbi:hypothetical protein [Nocardia pseudobrasiliensis]|uniref:Uncharacterized protein n=1 Tax=Nocardia pseudobrasiliensis TaxID=45979 RepID=A0A370IC37_9NOCA|nr:hypothetical protein [Nocardia pseudobrasiliensis]RDI68170.1 hypothetical protein DFR76_102571 [Nocardia pseudobrasiliensis]